MALRYMAWGWGSMCPDGCLGCGAVRGVQVQRAWADGAVRSAGDGMGVGHVDGVQDERWRGWEHGVGCDGGRTRRVVDGERVFRWKHGIERGGVERGGHGGREPDRERGGLRDEQVQCFYAFCAEAADGLYGI